MNTTLLRSKTKSPNERRANGLAAGIVINGSIHIPAWVIDHDSFRRWALSDAFPERGRFSWLNGIVWVEIYSDLLNHLSDAEIKSMHDRAFAPIRNRSAGSVNGSRDKHHGDILIDELVRIPNEVRDVDSFRRWAFSDEFPTHGQFAFLDGKLWVDLSMETNVHNQIKTAITIVLGSIVLNEALGYFYADSMLLSERRIGLSNEPDAMFVSHGRLKKGDAVLKQGDLSIELTGSVDMALEVVSKSSRGKDLIDAKTLYAKAGITEYWLIDSTMETPELVIMRLVGGKYVKTRKHDGWVKSNVFGRSFRLTCKKDSNDISQFNLETK